MNGILAPIFISVAAILAAFFAYRGIRMGVARYYALEREAILRRASSALIISSLLFISAVALLVYQNSQIAADPLSADDPEAAATLESDSAIQTQLATATPSPTPDLSAPPPSPTPVLCRAVVEGTGLSGLSLRSAPGGDQLAILAEGAIVTLTDTEIVTLDGFLWREVTSPARVTGWVADNFLTHSDCR